MTGGLTHTMGDLNLSDITIKDDPMPLVSEDKNLYWCYKRMMTCQIFIICG